MKPRIRALIAGLARRTTRHALALVGERLKRRDGSGRIDEPGVQLIEPAPRFPRTWGERLVVAKLKREGKIPFRVLVERVARELYLDELRRGAWVVDIGLFGEALFVPEVVRELQAADGILWDIERPKEEGDGILPDRS